MDTVRKTMNEFLQEQERVRREEERKARIAAEEAARKEQERLLAQAAKAEERARQRKLKNCLSRLKMFMSPGNGCPEGGNGKV